MVSSGEESDVQPGEALEWDVDMEIQLFYALKDHKPIGLNKHFNMACVSEELSNSVTKDVSPHDIWKHLSTLYDFNILEDTEPIPFPNNEINFKLPESEFGALIKQKCKDTLLINESDRDLRSPSPKTSTPRNSSRGSTLKDGIAKGRKDSISALATKTRKESGSSHASTDTPSNKSEKDYDPRRDSRDSNASGPRDSTSNRKSLSQREKTKSKVNVVADEETSSRRGRRRANTSTPPSSAPKRRRT